MFPHRSSRPNIPHWETKTPDQEHSLLAGRLDSLEQADQVLVKAKRVLALADEVAPDSLEQADLRV